MFTKAFLFKNPTKSVLADKQITNMHMFLKAYFNHDCTKLGLSGTRLIVRQEKIVTVAEKKSLPCVAQSSCPICYFRHTVSETPIYTQRLRLLYLPRRITDSDPTQPGMVQSVVVGQPVLNI